MFLISWLRRGLEGVALLWLKHGPRRRRPERHLDRTPTDAEQACIERTLVWAADYIGKPHPEMGRPGPVCPFVPRALNNSHLRVIVHSDVREITGLRAALLDDVHAFWRRFPVEDKHNEFQSLVLVFPHLEKPEALDRVHTELKSYLMSRSVMLSQFFRGSTKPGIDNPSFHVYQAPYPCIAVRYMGLHDILFLDHNASAFATYYERFAVRYAAGGVSNEFGYVDRYVAACARFSLDATTAPKKKRKAAPEPSAAAVDGH